MLVTFEGIDGSGKTTQIELIKKSCRQLKWEMQRKILFTRQPGGTEFSTPVRKLLMSKSAQSPYAELFMFMADRAEFAHQFDPYLEIGWTIFCDRGIDSTVAFQGFGRGLPVDMINNLNHIATRGRKPDLTFIFDLPVEVAQQRLIGVENLTTFDTETLDFHRRVRLGYLDIATNDLSDRVWMLKADDSIENLHAEIIREINDRLNLGLEVAR